jgi:hypothetical protein
MFRLAGIGLIFPGLLVAVGCRRGLSLSSFDDESVKGSGALISKELEISNTFKATITQSDEYRVSVTLDDNLLEYLIVEKQNGNLRVRLKRGISVRSVTLEASISLPEMSKVDASGASEATFSDFTASDDVDFIVSGASRIELAGTADEASIEASGASSARLEDFTVTSATASLSGASSADLDVTGKIHEIDLSGAFRLRYTGDPVVGDINSSGGSTVESR